MKNRLLFVFALGGLLMTAEIQAQNPPRGGERGGPGGQGGQRGGAGGQRGGPGGRPSMMTFLPVLAALDANKDGKISAKEIENAAAALKTLDKNGDGELTEEEVRPNFGGGRGGPGGRGGSQGRGGQSGANGRDGSPGQKGGRPQFDN
jgi:hypothetical protein